MPYEVPPAVVAGMGAGIDTATVIAEEAIGAGTGAATGAVSLLTVRTHGRDGGRDLRILRKHLVPLTSGRHAKGAWEPRHWAYWRREADAYRSGFVPAGPGLRAPHCYAVVDDHLYLEVVNGDRPSATKAAEVLAAWQQLRVERLDRPWLCTGQLRARVSVSELDWTEVDADPRMERLWERRHQLLAQLDEFPTVLSHGDYSLGNLVSAGDDVVALDWATVGWEPVGFDLAHLALSTGTDSVDAYLAAAPPAVTEPQLLIRGFAIAVALVGASRIHWMTSRRLEVPEWYTDFVWQHRPIGIA